MAHFDDDYDYDYDHYFQMHYHNNLIYIDITANDDECMKLIELLVTENEEESLATAKITITAGVDSFFVLNSTSNSEQLCVIR
ncbi:unnamed protein product [Brugia pahangi]|uniref:CPXV117 protein n=1 Tax=Brugia pahangi TaxID=6280 RepID=A0A0N4TNM6_BRUPA|nr:unnamed protein product [Brugia pahangi]